MHGKIDENKGNCAGNLTHFSTRDTTFARRVFLDHYELTRKFKTLRKKVNSATTCNSRFVGNISSLAGIFTGKAEKNYSNTLAFGSHNSLI